MPLAAHRFTLDDMHQMVRAGILNEDDRVELLDGQLVEMSPIEPAHASCVTRLERLLAPLVVSDRVTLRTQNPVVLDKHWVPQPDVVLVSYRADGYQTHHPEPGESLLVIEVADTTLPHDRDRKLPRYAFAKIPETWLVNLPDDQVEIYREPEDDRYTKIHLARRGETIAPLAFPNLTLSVDAILG